MKLEPIVNPHARMKNNQKSSKEEEKELLMAQTKQKVEERLTKRAEEKKNRKTAGATGKDGQGFADQSEGFALDEQVDKSTLSIRLLSEGYM